MKKIILWMLVVSIPLFFVFTVRYIYLGRKVNVIKGTASSLYSISKDIKISGFPSGTYKYIFKQNEYSKGFSLVLYGKIKQEEVKRFCLDNSLNLRTIGVEDYMTIKVPEILYKERNFYLTEFFEITGENTAFNIEMYVSRRDGRFYAKITHFIR